MEFNIFHEDYLGDDPKVVHADSAQEAALSYAAWYNSRGDHNLIDNPVDIVVEIDGLRTRFNISAEPDIYYTATPN